MTARNPNSEAVANHLLHCRQYLHNALDALRVGEPGKAGELIWGSVSQAVHAVDAWRGPVVESHRDLLNFARNLGREIGDPSFPNNFQSAKSLHDNFYMPLETVEEVEDLLPGILQAITQILSLLPEEAANGHRRG